MNHRIKSLPFSDIIQEFLNEYSSCTTYWYVPKAKTLSIENIRQMKKQLEVIYEDFINFKWNGETQDILLKTFQEKQLVNPYRKDGKLSDRTALVRIWKKWFETLGLLWIRHDQEFIITDVGLNLIMTENDDELINVIENQIAKYQYPNPSVENNSDFSELIPHLFLLQILKEVEYISLEEYEFFINLAQQHTDLKRIIRYIKTWRDLGKDEQKIIITELVKIPMCTSKQKQISLDSKKSDKKSPYSRHRRIKLNRTYQRAFFCFPRYLSYSDSDKKSRIICTESTIVDKLIREFANLKIPQFTKKEDWFFYYGNPEQRPSWFTHLLLEIDKAKSYEEAKNIIQKNRDKLSQKEAEEINKKQIEKGIETFYESNLSLLEEGLCLVKEGRQFSTPIGRLDLLCRGKDGKYVVVEIKANEANDSVFGQILRYIGWIHRNINDGKDNVRGIILASNFPEKARYSRIGLLKQDYETFIKFKKHGLNLLDY